ncbi:tripartite tricarboxylate transporter substrate binding protein [Siccirubricoccus sp. KC 17139]|uniref:Tripartite tricarboxylate transporter substrate binding protein n=1 Tax=Siccirubricoccus soli TaxID=2899147 RepID=A0ABT1D9C9_9PROT|nr:tripartite tricarboxylate transporter substrate binding protein [Siccirubricoccus soli]MCO6418539.1 tripartite tricarboxylate transporter substrate binding protein [Siccirubricoccus soli]MCP2684674.1 tripartite tricarboxylate transporter substrate binding protein [Siccirubricoccus soli]
MRSVPRRPLLQATLALPGLAAAGLAAPGGAGAQPGWPNRPVTFVMPVAPGGPGDVIGRPLAQHLQAALGQPCVIDNRPGAGGTIALDYALRSRPDGHTLVVYSNSTYSIAPHLYPMPYDNATAFAPVALIAQAPSFVCTHRSVPAATLPELLALLRREPETLSFATAGIGFTSHLATELFMALSGTKMLHVPYRGGAPAAQALSAGEVQVNFMEAALVRSLLPAGHIRALAVTSRTRHPLLPDIPTIEEAGVPGFESATYWAMVAPAGVPAPVQARLAEELLRWMALPATQERLTQAGFLPIGGGPAALARHMTEDTAKWGEIIRARGIRIA